MDAAERRRKKRREEKRRMEQERQLPPKRVSKIAKVPAPGLPPPVTAKPYTVNVKAVRRMGVDLRGLNEAIADVMADSSKRLSDMLQSVEHSPLPEPLDLKRVQPAIIPQDDFRPSSIQNKNMADAFNEPERVKSDPPREKNTCKDRPKNNRSKIGGGGKKRFIPWC